MLVIGLMSGTSADGVDAALVEWPDDGSARPFDLIGFEETAFPGEFQQRIHRLAAGRLDGPEVLAELVALDRSLGERFADAADAVLRAASVEPERLSAVASHGQTVAHHPEHGGTLQIGSAAVIAERLGCPVVSDFRPRDMAAGGEGAPLAPFFHAAAFGHADENRGVLNLGGISNLTWLPAGDPGGGAIGFDIGPANSLVDGVVQLITDGASRMDRDGARALNGRVEATFLARLLEEDDYLARPAPKSTGRERYGSRESALYLERWRQAFGGERDDDLIATLVAYTTEAVGLACRELLPGGAGVDRLLVGGGGAANPAVMRALEAALPRIPVDRFDDHGVPAGAAEAMAFSLMGRNALLGLPNHLPTCTGARGERVLGVISPARGT